MTRRIANPARPPTTPPTTTGTGAEGPGFELEVFLLPAAPVELLGLLELVAAPLNPLAPVFRPLDESLE